MSKETQPITNVEKPLPPSVVFQNAEIKAIGGEKYNLLRSRAIDDNAELRDAETLRQVEERIGYVIGSIPTDSLDSFMDLALNRRPDVNSMIHRYIKEIKQESQKQKKRLH